MLSWLLLVLPHWPWTATAHRRPSWCSRSLPLSSESNERKPVASLSQIALGNVITSYDIKCLIVPEHSGNPDTKTSLPVWGSSGPDAPSWSDWGRTASVGCLFPRSDFWRCSFWKISFSLRENMNNETIMRTLRAWWCHGTFHPAYASFRELKSGLVDAQ